MFLIDYTPQDASGSGLGAALLQEGRPIAYTSRALTDTETRYAPIELEMLAIVFSLEKFHQYTYGRHTIVHSDHKPLESIMKKPLHKAPRRLQGMMLRLQMYDIEVRYQQGKTMALADALSRAHPTGQKLQHDAQFETVSSMLCVKDEKAEAAVKVVKQLIRKAVESNSDPYLALLDHRNTPSEKCQSSPAQRLFNRRTRTLLPTTESLLAPKVVAAKDRLKERQMKMKELYDKGAKPLNPLEEGDVVRMKPFKLTDKTWSKAVISKRLDERSYLVETDDGSEYRRNRQDLRSSNEDQTPQITTPNPEPILEQILEAIDPIPTQSQDIFDLRFESGSL